MTNLGASFKKARESKGISLDQIASETRISKRFLTAIENEEFHQLPGGIFNRGFVRAYAEQVGLDPVQAVADYERLVETGEPSETPPTVPSPPPTKIERHLYPIAIVALLLLIVVFYVVTRDSANTAQTASPPPPAPTSQPEPQSQPAPPTRPISPPETVSAATVSEAALPLAAEPLRIDLEAKEPTWIKVTADGTTINVGEILKPGMTRRFTAQNSIDLSIGNAGGLRLKINDIQAKPLGKAGQVRKINITQNNLKDFTS